MPHELDNEGKPVSGKHWIADENLTYADLREMVQLVRGLYADLHDGQQRLLHAIRQHPAENQETMPNGLTAVIGGLRGHIEAGWSVFTHIEALLESRHERDEQQS